MEDGLSGETTLTCLFAGLLVLFRLLLLYFMMVMNSLLLLLQGTVGEI